MCIFFHSESLYLQLMILIDPASLITYRKFDKEIKSRKISLTYIYNLYGLLISLITTNSQYLIYLLSISWELYSCDVIKVYLIHMHILLKIYILFREFDEIDTAARMSGGWTDVICICIFTCTFIHAAKYVQLPRPCRICDLKLNLFKPWYKKWRIHSALSWISESTACVTPYRYCTLHR